MSVHATALVDPAARLGPGVEIGPLAVIGPDVEIGAGCRIGPHVVVHRYTQLGPRCVVHAGAVLGDTPQDLAFREAESRVRIGAETELREGVTVHRGTKPGTETVIGERCLLMANSHVGHNTQLGREVIMANGVLLAGYVTVGDRAFLSGNALVHQFCRIGRLALLSGGCAVSKDVPPFCVIGTITFNRVSGLNVVGMRRAGLTPTERLAVKRAFRILYREGLSVRQALPRLRAGFPDGPAAEFATFIEASRRGICGLEPGAGDGPDGDAGGRGE